MYVYMYVRISFDNNFWRYCDSPAVSDTFQHRIRKCLSKIY